MIKITQNANLLPWHTFAAPAAAKYFVEIFSLEDFYALFKTTLYKSYPKCILGTGSNVLFTEDYPGIIIKNTLQGLEILKETRDHVWLKIASGEIWDTLVQFCVQKGYGGIENLIAIPGTVGAAPVQNIGAYGAEIAQVIDKVEAISLQSGEQLSFNPEDCNFRYRDSIFRNKDNAYFIYGVTIRLSKKGKPTLSYGNLAQALSQKKRLPSIKNVAKTILEIRSQKLPDPKEIPNAGSFFKNPRIPSQVFHDLSKTYPNLPKYNDKNGYIKIPAAWLIEHSDWEVGKPAYEPTLYDYHALIITNPKHTPGKNIQDFSQYLIDSVRKKFGITLQPEVNIF